MAPMTDDERLLSDIQRWPREYAQEFRLLRDFAKWVIRNSSFAGSDLDGGEVQTKALELGFLIEVPYDREKHGVIDDLDDGDPLMEYAGPLKTITSPALNQPSVP